MPLEFFYVAWKFQVNLEIFELTIFRAHPDILFSGLIPKLLAVLWSFEVFPQISGYTRKCQGLKTCFFINISWLDLRSFSEGLI